MHYRFGVPVPLLEAEAKSTIPIQTERAKVLADASLIVIDEATMGHGRMYRLIDEFFRDLMGSIDGALADVPFGGKVIVLSGDFRQLHGLALATREQGILLEKKKFTSPNVEKKLCADLSWMALEKILSTPACEQGS